MTALCLDGGCLNNSALSPIQNDVGVYSIISLVGMESSIASVKPVSSRLLCCVNKQKKQRNALGVGKKERKRRYVAFLHCCNTGWQCIEMCVLY